MITEITIGMTIATTILEKAELGLGKGNTQVILEGMMKAVVDQDHIQEPVRKKIESGVLNVENMTISPMTVLTQSGKRNRAITTNV